MRITLLVCVALLGCEKKKSSAPGAAPPASTEELDALWALAPEGAFIGFVIGPSGLANLESSVAHVERFFAAVPELAPIKARAEAELQEMLGTKTPSLAALGMSAKKGLAVFAVEGSTDPVMILPVTDRDKFLKVAKGEKGADSDKIKRETCKTVKNVYACARDPRHLDTLGKGKLTEQLKLAGARGDIEFAASIPEPKLTIGAVAQLARGTVVLRGGVKGIPSEAKQFLANAKPRVDGDKTSGFALINIGPYMSILQSKVPPVPIAEGVTAADLVKTITGPLTLTIPNGSIAIDMRVPLTDGGPAQKLVEQCDKLPPLQEIGATVKDGACHLPMKMQVGFDIDAWVDGKTLRVGQKGSQATGKSTPLSPLAKELAEGDWIVAMVGRGTMLSFNQPIPMPVPVDQMPLEGIIGIRSLAMLNELGIGVRVDGDVVRVLIGGRSAWANSDDVIAKLVAIDPAAVLSGKAGAAGKAIAEAHPKSPFAEDYAAGYGGLMAPAAVVGILAAVAIPAYMDYMKKSKVSEAQLILNKLGKNAKVAYITNAEFPKGRVAAAKSCCGQSSTGGDIDNKCPPDPATWKDPVWQELDFQIDEPTMYRYSYESDGKTFTAKAHGDLDCDGQDAEWVMTGTSDGGNPSVTVTPPPRGEY